MQVSFKTHIVFQYQRKDKNYPVSIRIGWKSRYVYISTKYYIGEKDISKNRTVKNAEINDGCNLLISRYREIIKDVDVENYDVKGIVDLIQKKSLVGESIDFMKYFQDQLSEMLQKNDPSKEIYRATYNHLVNYSGNSIPVQNITLSFIKDFEKYLSKNNVGVNGQVSYLGKLRAMYNRCVDDYEDLGFSFGHPFRKYSFPVVKPRKPTTLSKELLLEILNHNPKTLRGKRAQLLFAISLMTLGANAKDLFELKKGGFGRVQYERSKVRDKRLDNGFISMEIQPELKPYIDKCKGKNNYLFCFRDWYKNMEALNKMINKGLDSICDEINIEIRDRLIMLENSKFRDTDKNNKILAHLKKLLSEQFKNKELNDLKKMSLVKFDQLRTDSVILKFDYYDARRTIASVMRNKLGISEDDVALCLNHVDLSHRTTDYYIEPDFSIIDKCNRKFLDWLFEKKI